MISLSKLRKKTKQLKRERTLLVIYGIVVTIALVVSLYNQNNATASINRQETIEYFDANNSVADENATIDVDEQTEKDSQYNNTDDKDIDSLVDSTDQIANIGNEQMTIEVNKGDTFITILTSLGINYEKAEKITKAYKKVYNIAKELKIGQKIQISVMKDFVANQIIDIESILIEPSVGTRYIVELTDNEEYTARKETDEFKKEYIKKSGTIKGTLTSSMQNAGIPNSIAADFVSIFGFSIDFSRDIHPNDKFEVVYEAFLAPDGKIVKTGNVLYAGLTVLKDEFAMYRFTDNSGKTDYFDSKGQALKKSLNKKPLALSRARISSRFGRRFHPILKQMKMHTGVDYAAPIGTQVYAAGDGVVQMAQYNGGYGNFVKIRHNSDYSTGYGHMKSFAKGIRSGVRVKQGQVIGYVGNTGRSTGPHLHFEVIKRGVKVDPLKEKAATGENLYGNSLQSFKKVVQNTDNIRKTSETEVVQNKADETSVDKHI